MFLAIRFRIWIWGLCRKDSVRRPTIFGPFPRSGPNVYTF